MSCLGPLLLGALTLFDGASGRNAPPPALPDPRAPALAAADAALAAGDRMAAVAHLLNALWYDPRAVDVLARLAAAHALDPDPLALWQLELAAAAADPKGAIPAKIAAADPLLAQVATGAAKAVRELASAATKARAGARSGPLLARYARSLAFEIGGLAPAALDAEAAAFEAACAPRPDAHVPVIDGLKKLLAEGLAAGRADLAIAAARALNGLIAQTGFFGLKGPKPPDLSALRPLVADGLGRARALVATAAGAPLTIEQLELMEPEQVLEFNQLHSSFAHPAVALSPAAKYRIETTCGHRTLLGAAETVEAHHERLARWYGRDPFQSQGIVRIVPEATGLEAEGAPHWWAGGFQGGDVTTLRFNASDVASLGRGLTHELTHRFDGLLYPGLPAWLMEGRAVWTAAAYGSIQAEEFVQNHASFGTIEEAMRKGYGGEAKLKELIEGTIEDYRDNYPAGYALYVYLNTWDVNGAPLFKNALRAFMADIERGRKKPLAWFETCFCDGKSGRPKGLAEFAKGFSNFINGFYWLNPAPEIRDRYTQDTGSRDEVAAIEEFPIWGFRRNRAEPWFGDGQAAIAGELLARSGRVDEALAAFTWAFESDEWSNRRALLYADLAQRKGDVDGAWILRATTRYRTRPEAAPNPGPAPFLGRLPETRKLHRALEDAAKQLLGSGRPLAAARLAAERDRLGARLGLPAGAIVAPLAADSAPPAGGVPHAVGSAGWLEEELTGYDEHRVRNLFYDTGDGSLHVGREKPREATGQLDRTAHWRHAFARASEWQPQGRYRVSGRIHFTTSFASGSVVLGFTRRDRNVRLDFSAGDYMYAIGQKDDLDKWTGVHVRLQGLRDGEWHGQTSDRKVDFAFPAPSFGFELLVDGPLVVAWMNGERIGTYCVPDGQPIEGSIGFAAGFGAYRVELPTVARLDAPAWSGALDPRSAGLSLEAAGPVTSVDLLNRPARGLPTGPAGTVVVWVPYPDVEAPASEGADPVAEAYSRSAAIAARAAIDLRDLLQRDGYAVPLALAISDALGEPARAELKRALAADPPVECPVLFHAKREALSRSLDEALPSEQAVAVFLDPAGIVRAMSPLGYWQDQLPGELLYWLKILRGRERESLDG